MPVHKALREALTNCLVNTDFYVPRGVVIKKENDLLILENPGYIRTGKEQRCKGGTRKRDYPVAERSRKAVVCHHESTEQRFELLCTFLVVYDIIENRVTGKY